MMWMNRKTVPRASLTITIALALMSGLAAKDKLDIMNRNAFKMMVPAYEQTYVYHTNGNMWMGWDSYGNTGDQTCSAIIPGWVYPGTFSTGGHGWLNYNCRAGYWIIAKIDTEFVEGTTGEYVVTRGTTPGPTSQGWAGSDTSYNKEPWESNTTWYINEAGLTVNAVRKSWSFPGESNSYFAVGDYDYNDFVIEEISIINTGSTVIDELVFGGKADHDCTWNVPYPDWDYPFWTDDIVDYDATYLLTMELDGDDQGSAVNDFGIDDPNREYRGVRVAQTILNLNGTAYSSLTASDVNHMWWTGDEDPQTAAARYAMATMVSGSSGDKKDSNPPAMDMRYLQSYSVDSLAVGDTAKFVVAVLAGAGLANTQKAAANARQAYDYNFDLPKPPAAPAIATDGVATNSDGHAVITWTYTAAQIAAVDPDIGSADFAGFRVYRSSPVPRKTSKELGLSADNLDASYGGEMIGDIDAGSSFSPNAGGPYTEIADIAYSNGSFATVTGFMDMSSMMSQYMYTDKTVGIGVNYWYYVAAYDAGGASTTHGVTLPSLESYSTMCYPLVYDPYGLDKIPTTPPMFTVKPEELQYTDLAGKTVTDVFVTPNPWRALDMETYHGAATATGYFIRFYNVDVGDIVEIYDVAGNLVFKSASTDIAEKGTYDWNLISRTRNQVGTGVYYWRVGSQNGKLAIIR